MHVKETALYIIDSGRRRCLDPLKGLSTHYYAVPPARSSMPRVLQGIEPHKGVTP